MTNLKYDHDHEYEAVVVVFSMEINWNKIQHITNENYV